MKNNEIKIIGICIKDRECIENLNQLLSEFGEFIIGRFGIQYYKEKCHIITLIIDAPISAVNELIKKINLIDYISVIDGI